jgi:hypothetical integral membrane protein (TIGR02206 family)
VHDRGRPLFALSTWSAAITLPSDGAWELRATVFGTAGGWLESTVKVVTVRAGTPSREFRTWSVQHLVAVALIVAAAFTLGFFVRRSVRRGGVQPAVSPQFRRASLLLVGVLWVNEVCYQVYWYTIGGWAVPTALIVQMCGLSILFLPMAMLSENTRTRQRLFDILYFWGIGGASQALIAPDIGTVGFPAFRYFAFFISHGLIIVCTIVMALSGGVRITGKSLLRALVVSTVLLVPFYAMDKLIALIPPYDPGNYFVLGYPPPTGSIIDVFAAVFGPSPWYAIGLVLMGIALFSLLYLPWPIARWIRSHSARARGSLPTGDEGA